MIGVNIQFLKAKKRSILLFDKENDIYKHVVFDPKNITIDKKFIRFGDYFGDQITGYYNINEVANCVATIVKDF